MANKYTNTLNDIWGSLGTFWGQFPDKDDITKFWELYLETTDELYRRKAIIHLSKNMESLVPTLTYPNSVYYPVFSGDAENVIEISGLDSFEVDKYTYSIPTLSGLETVQTLTEGVEYQIHNKSFIQFLTPPEYDPANTGFHDNVSLYADTVYRHNPILWEIHASGVGMTISSLDNEDYLPYNIIAGSGNERVIDIADHYKYLIWGLEEIKRRPPTIANLTKGFGISRGLPFVYRPGTVQSVIGDDVTILVSGYNTTTDTYTIPAGYTTTAVSGVAMDQFSLLISGLAFKDHVNNYDYIMALPNINDFNNTSTVVFTYPSNFDDLNYNTTYHTTYVASLMPAGLSYQSLTE